MHSHDARQAKRILWAQLGLALFAGGIALLLLPAAAPSVLTGGAIATVANALFALWVFGRYRAEEPGKMVFRFYGAELVKLLALVAMFIAAFVWLRPLDMPALLGSFFIVQVLPPVAASWKTG